MKRLPRSTICRGLSARTHALPLRLTKPQSLLRTITSSPLRRFSTILNPQPPSQNTDTHSQDSLNDVQALESEIHTSLFGTANPGEESLNVPTESDVLSAFNLLTSFTKTQIRTPTTDQKPTPTSVLLSLEEESTPKPRTASKVLTDHTAPGPRIAASYSPYSSQTTKKFQALAETAFELLSHPNVFITEKVLEAYVNLCALIRNPANVPAAFALYALKPVYNPRKRTSWFPNPKQAKYAIPERIASKALDAAIESKDIFLCLDIIDTSYATDAFRGSKLVRKALPTAVVGVLTPPAAYVFADTLAGYQDEVDHALAVKYAFGGLLAYLGFTASIGVTALMTANDQMVRVTWVVGTPLRERWLREEERAALDRVAMAWGFEEVNRRGFEEGEEWELLGEVVARKGMVLDNSALMEGME